VNDLIIGRRPRRLRKTEGIRRMVRENYVSVDDLVYPVFVTEGTGVKREIASMPGIHNFSLDMLEGELEKVVERGIPAVLFFGVPSEKDETGSGAYADDGIIQSALRLAKSKFPSLTLIADVCLCEYTSHGHCGIISDGDVLNDPTLELLARVAVSCAEAGADMLAPSDMMDGRIGFIRGKLDEAGFEDKAIMAYSVKYASSFYGPFRDAAQSAPSFGDRKTYQMDIANSKEAIIEASLDVEEGADILMVKPGLSYLDILRDVSSSFDLPVAVYNVSGEYAMVKAAAMNGWIDEKKIVLEIMTSMKRAGASMIITYHALDVAEWIKKL
jgi:porphobilinogen synthase